MPRSTVLTFLLASATAFAVWALSPWFTGHKEPWDAPGIYYYAALLIAGMVSGLINVKPLWAHYLGGIFGQLLYAVVFLPLGPLAGVGLIFLAVWSLLFMAGGYLGLRARTLVLGQ
jgi:hypothetical protein